MEFNDFLIHKSQIGYNDGFDPLYIPDFLFDFQKVLVEWSIKKGRCGGFYDCGMGKTPMQLVWGQNVIQHTNKPVLLIAPLAVSSQTSRECGKFSIDSEISRDGKYTGKRIIITNYERLHYFSPDDFGGVICDESSAIKSFNGKHRQEVTEFLRTIKYRSLWTATAAPNDYIELGTSSEALGELGQMDMLSMFFKNDQNNNNIKRERQNGGKAQNWRFKGHAELAFWKWVCSWARAARRPSDIGFSDGDFILPPLIENEVVIPSADAIPGMLFSLPATNWREERYERKNTIKRRCEEAAKLVDTKESAIIWCHLNTEGDLLQKIIPGSVQVSGQSAEEEKESAYMGFSDKSVRVLIIKPKIGAFGMNWQHCNHIITFASHSYEQYYQAVRRCWRFGQKRPVTVDIILSEGEVRVRDNMKRKAEAADKMFTRLVAEMNHATKIDRSMSFDMKEEVPSWLSSIR